MSVESFASVSDLEARWKPLDSDQKAQADVLLGDATAIVKEQAPGWERVDPRLLKIIVCEMVVGVMGKPDLFGVTSIQQGAGPYQETQSFANPMGDFWFSPKHIKWLGLNKQRAFTISLGPHGRDHHHEHHR